MRMRDREKEEKDEQKEEKEENKDLEKENEEGVEQQKGEKQEKEEGGEEEELWNPRVVHLWEELSSFFSELGLRMSLSSRHTISWNLGRSLRSRCQQSIIRW